MFKKMGNWFKETGRLTKQAFKELWTGFVNFFKYFKFKIRYLGFIGYILFLITIAFVRFSVWFMHIGFGIGTVSALFLAITYRILYVHERDDIDYEIAKIAKKKMEESGGVYKAGDTPIDRATEKAMKRYLRRYKNAFWIHLIFFFAIGEYFLIYFWPQIFA
jgi:hypothetical protein